MRPPGQKRYMVRHTVQKGDTLYSIAWRYGQDYRQVAAWNHIDAPYEIYVGEELLIIPPNRYSGPKDLPNRTASPPAGRSQHRSQPSRQQSDARESAATRVSKTPVSRKRSVEGGRVDWAWPTDGKLAARFSVKSGKKGVDIAGESGQSIRAAAPGAVVYSGNGLIGYGNLLIIKHNNSYLSAYGHNKKLLVKEGDKVNKGQEIAKMGQTSRSGSILYFEIRRGGKPVDPLKYLPNRRL